MTDVVRVNGLMLDVHIGFHEYERHILQRVQANISLETDFRKGPSADDHSGLIDYFELTRAVTQSLQSRSFELIEALAEHICLTCLGFAAASQVRVELIKRPMDMPNVTSVSVECVRSRSAGGTP